MMRPPTRSTRTDTLYPDTTRVRAPALQGPEGQAMRALRIEPPQQRAGERKGVQVRLTERGKDVAAVAAQRQVVHAAHRRERHGPEEMRKAAAAPRRLPPKGPDRRRRPHGHQSQDDLPAAVRGGPGPPALGAGSVAEARRGR